MAQYSFPGVYPTIIDLSQVVTANAVTSCAYVGESDFGPINTPTLVSNLKSYVDKFGQLNPKFGYMGYSLAVASDTINTHYVVRVVDEETARYGAKFVALKGKTAKTFTSGYTIEEIKAGKEDSNSFFIDSTTSTEDGNDAFVVVSHNPNNKIIKLTIEDSTINTNKNISSISNSKTAVNATLYFSQENLFEQDNKVELTINETEKKTGKVAAVFDTYNLGISIKNKGHDYSVDDTVTIGNLVDSHGEPLVARILNVDAEGGVLSAILTVTNDTISQVSGDYETTNLAVEDTENADGLVVTLTCKEFRNGITVTFDEQLTNEELAEEWTTVRALKLPEDNETTFSVAVYEVNGRVTTRVEYYQYVTLYANKDNNGNSTYIEDVINGKSNYIQVFANTTSAVLDENEYPIPESITLQSLEGNTSGLLLSKSTNGMKYLTDGWDNFSDRTETTVSLLMNSGYAYESNIAYQSKMVEIAEKRRDCFALLDVPQTISSKADSTLDWRKNILGFNTYRASLTTPWVKTYDSVQGKSGFLMAPSAYVAKVMGTSRPWIAAAGPNRGIISSATVNPIGLTASYDDTVGGSLYDAQLNCIVRNPGAGYAIWGQKTLQQKPSALDRVNVARTVIYIETTLRDAARYHLFENNTAFERMQVTLQFNQFLDTVLSDGGIQRYQVICDDSNNTPYIIANNTMVIDIYLWPTYTTEFIELNSIIMGPEANITVSSN